MTKTLMVGNVGSSLIEVLVAIVLVGLVVSGVMLSITYSVKNSAEARYREIASQLAQDGMELVILERSVEPWSEFDDKLGSTYCINENTVNLTQTTGCNNNVENENKDYTRVVSFTGNTNEITATVTVSWMSDSNVAQDVEISQKFLPRAN